MARTYLVPSLLFLAAVGFTACDEPRPAWDAFVYETVSDPKVEVMESAPPRFALNVTAAMPSPGYTFEDMKVARPDDQGRIVVTVNAPLGEGAWPSVITPMPLRIPLGGLDEGVYLVEIRMKIDPHPMRHVGAVVLHARAR